MAATQLAVALAVLLALAAVGVRAAAGDSSAAATAAAADAASGHSLRRRLQAALANVGDDDAVQQVRKAICRDAVLRTRRLMRYQGMRCLGDALSEMRCLGGAANGTAVTWHVAPPPGAFQRSAEQKRT